MTIFQIVLLIVTILFAVLAAVCVCATFVPGYSSSAVPIFGVLFWFFGIIAAILGIILGLTFLL